MERKKITFDSFIRGVITILLCVGALYLIHRLSGVLLPFFVAWLIAYMVYPLVHFIQYRLHFKSRIISIFCALALVGAVGTGGFLLIVPPMVEEIGRVNQLLITYFSQGSYQGNVPELLSEFVRDHLGYAWLSALFQEESSMEALRDALPKVWALLSESVNLLFSVFTLFIMLLYVVFILMDYESISQGWVGLLPPKYRPFTVRLLTDIKEGMNRYFRGQTLVAFCVGVLFSIGFLIIDFPLAIGLGMLIGLLNLVPYLQVIGFIPTVLLAILKTADTGGNFWLILGSALLVFVVVQVIQDGFLVPRIMGHITGLNPAIILLSLSVWGSLMGMLGMIIALPLTTLMLSYYQHYIVKRDHYSPPEEAKKPNSAEIEAK
ncbi:MAG: AI-2E family transporter [Mediterranea sp.]|nr:AI-2E family transporter [Mediterranea sp.]